MRGFESQLDKLRKGDRRARCGGHALAQRDQRSRRLAAHRRRSQCASAERKYLDHGTRADFGGRIVGETALGSPPPATARTRRGRAVGRAGAKSVPMIDGVFVRGLYLSNPKQQEIVVDYFRNLLGSTVFRSRSEQAIGSDQTEHADEHGVGLSLRAAAEVAPALRPAMNWFRQNRFLGAFLAALALGTLLCALFSSSRKGRCRRGTGPARGDDQRADPAAAKQAVPERRKFARRQKRRPTATGLRCSRLEEVI